MAGFAAHFLHDEAGATAIEYGLIACFIFLAIVSVLTQVGSNLNAVFTSINNGLD
jgi:pilus assembly protein Flp/PilA